jgi:hypothetical protein
LHSFGNLIGVLLGGTGAPVARSPAPTTAEDTALPVTLDATDPDGDPLTYSLVDGPAHGTLTGVPPTLTYTPDPDYNGPDSFTFTASDGLSTSNTATVSITVTPVDDPTLVSDVCLDGVKSRNYPSGSVGLDLRPQVREVDGDTLTWTLVSGPSVGTLTGALPQVTFEFPWAHSGRDSFTWRVNDGHTDSSVATVTIRSGGCGKSKAAFH